MTNILVWAETELADAEQAALAGATASIAYIDNVFVTDIEPELLAALKTALVTFGSPVLAQIIGQLIPGSTVTVPTTDAPAA